MPELNGNSRRNVELKARLDDLEAARKSARQVCTQSLGVLRQVDTYFHARHGRLKLREFDDRPAELIWYARPDAKESKTSDYQVVPVTNPATLKAALASALGIWVVVEKQRELFLAENVRIHLDQVARLGDFLEFEAVLEDEMTAADGEAAVARLRETFQIADEALVAGSYSDLLLAQLGNGSVASE